MTDTVTMNLTDFLLARIAEDEAEAANWSRFEIRDGIPGSYGIKERVLAECEAKRRIVNLSWHHLGDEDFAGGMEYAKEQVLEVMAAVYADHPDYRDEWRP